MNRFSAIVFLSLALLAACGGKKSDEGTAAPAPTAAPTAAPAAPPAAPTVDPAAKATEIFSTRCTPCHGPSGHGDGPASAQLTPPPRNFGDPAWQSSVTDEHIEKIIKFGGAAVGKSPSMPANPDLTDPAVVAALRAHVRSLSGK